MSMIPEPPIHDDDTSPSITIRPEEFDERLQAMNQPSAWQSTVGWLSLVGAALFTIAALVILIMPGNNNSEMPNIADASITETATLPVIATEAEAAVPTQVNTPEQAVIETDSDSLPPIVPAEQFADTLFAPITGDVPLARVLYNPFTVVNTDRARSEFINYTVVQGDTMDAISQRYGLQAESIAWCNDRRVVLVLRPNDVLRIPPVDGACHQVFGTREETVAEIATKYKIDDPFIIIDSEYNRGQLPPNVTPNDILLGGANLFIPGGEGEVITWNAAEQETDASGNVIGVSFANGQSGSCGSVAPAGGAAWGNPLPNGTWVRGFSGAHGGLDLSAPTGTPILAANSGYVLFSGFSNWGYGQAVVIEHGPVQSTLYGHMSARNVSCGQFVTVGQVIGFVGSTGNSSGPHLHFELQVNTTAVNPSGTPGLGW